MCVRNEVDLKYPCLVKMCVTNEVNLVPMACEDVHKERSGLSTLGLLRCA